MTRALSPEPPRDPDREALIANRGDALYDVREARVPADEDTTPSGRDAVSDDTGGLPRCRPNSGWHV